MITNTQTCITSESETPAIEVSAQTAAAPSESKDVSSGAGRPAAKPKHQTNKSVMVQKMLSRNRGASLNEIMAATQWQPHSTRAFLTGLRKKGLTLVRETRGNGETGWRIER